MREHQNPGALVFWGAVCWCGALPWRVWGPLPTGGLAFRRNLGCLRGGPLLVFSALRAWRFASRRSLDAYAACDFASPAWGKGGLLGAAPLLILMPNPVLRALGRHRRLRRRAVRHENQSSTARQSRDLLLISGRVDVANTPSGLCPFCPLASSPKHPQRGLSVSVKLRGRRVFCCGSFPPSLRSLR